MHRSLLMVILLILLPLVRAMAGPAVLVEEDWESYHGWEIKSYDVEGAPVGMAGAIKRGLAGTGKWKIFQRRQRPEFSARMLAEDLARIRLLLARNGYPSAFVIPEVTPKPESRELELRLMIVPGDPVRIGRIELNGWPDGAALPDSADKKNLSVGDVVGDESTEAAREYLHRQLLDAGYALGTVQSRILPLDLSLVAVVYNVDHGQFFRITEVEIVGCSEDLLGVAHRVMNIKPGMVYSQKLLTNASLDLRSTQLFGMVVLEIEPIGPGELKLTTRLENGRMRTLEASVGTFTDNPWLVRAGWMHRNLFTRGIGFDAAGVVGTYRLGAGIGANVLGFLSPRARTRLGVGFLVEDEDAYKSEESRADLVQSFRPRRRDIWNVGTTISYTDVNRKNPDATDIPESQGRLLELWTDVKWDRTTDPVEPKSGGYFKTSFTIAPPGFFSEIPYVSLQCDASVYRSPVKPVVVAARGRVGWGNPLGDSVEILATRRFYAGGYNTHRGYGRRKLGPLDSAGDALGGEFVALAGMELRFPLIWIFDAAIFTDAGQIWATPKEATLAEIPVAVGLDLDLMTPLGPIRLGYGWNVINQVAGQPHGIFHFGIGYPW